MSEEKKVDNVSFVEEGNNAWLKYEAAEPLDIEEACQIAGIDLDIWEPEIPLINFWTMGRKKREVRMEWEDGKANGYVNDTGEILRSYNYQIKIAFTRRQRIAVLPVLQPIKITSRSRCKKEKPLETKHSQRILFITDPHFGFRTPPFAESVAFHSRRFISDLLALVKSLRVDLIVWGGDILDLADYSRWPKKPDIINNTQIAAIETGWVIHQFGMHVDGQKFIEGNHDARMPFATATNFAAAYELKPVYDLEGPAMLSVPRILGIDQADWYDGYPDAYLDVGDVRFIHGDRASGASGATVATMHRHSLRTEIFGHIHRHEEATRHTDDREGAIIKATPGCACRKEHTPGANRKRNWSIGAFYITMVNDRVRNIEHISHEYGETWFRGDRYRGIEYTEHMAKDIPEKYMQAL